MLQSPHGGEADVDNILTVEEVAERLKVTPDVVRELLRTGKLKGFKLGKYWRVEEPEVDRLIQTLKKESHDSDRLDVEESEG